MPARRSAQPCGPRSPQFRGWSEGVAKEYAEAVKRAPKRDDLRLSLAEAELALGHGDEALQQANILIEHNASSASALVLKARALSQTRGTAGQIKAGRDEAVRLLTNALQNQPTFAAAYHLIAEIEMMNRNRAAALDSLRRGLKAVPNDSAGLAQLVQILAQPGPDGNPPTPDDLSEATAWADRLAEPDVSGELALSVSIGFHRAGQIDQALPWAEKAVERQGSWVAHLNYADLLLGRAESLVDSAPNSRLFEQAAAEYDAVLAQNANSVEAINNKAWILHQYLDRNAEALAVAEGLVKRVDPSVLPPDFFDTLGSIQEAMNRTQAAEGSYAEGLRRASEHPILNYHMGRLLSADRNRSSGAVPYLKKARAAREVLPPQMADEVESLLRGSAN